MGSGELIRIKLLFHLNFIRGVGATGWSPFAFLVGVRFLSHAVLVERDLSGVNRSNYFLAFVAVTGGISQIFVVVEVDVDDGQIVGRRDLQNRLASR
jgi:hypothetical protein